MGKAISDTERQAILDLLPTGKSARQIADEVGRSVNTVSRVAKSVGHEWGRVNVANARLANKAYGTEARAATAAKMHAEVDRLLASMHQPHVAFNFGGKDNTYAEHEFPEPDVATKHTIIRAAATGMRMVVDIDRHDNRDDVVTSDFERWLRLMTGQEQT